MILQIKNISKSYKNNKVLDNINITLKPGIYGLLGPNGAGKTTLINIITGLVKQDSGVIHSNGFSTNYTNVLGYLPQNQCYYNNFTGLELIEYIMELKNYRCVNKREYALKLLKDVNLYDVYNKKIKTYSGGMKQRIGIAQALIGNPELLIFDEPTSGLDPTERIRFRNILSYISTNKIIILSTHIITDISFIADKVIMLNKGKITLQGTEKEIVNTLNKKVWEVKCDKENIYSITKKYKVSSIGLTDYGYKLRIVSNSKPDKLATIVDPNLDDVCLYYFGEV